MAKYLLKHEEDPRERTLDPAGDAKKMPPEP